MKIYTQQSTDMSHDDSVEGGCWIFEFPNQCGQCIHCDIVADDGFNFYVCSHEHSADQSGVPLYVMPTERPPDECPIIQLLIKASPFMQGLIKKMREHKELEGQKEGQRDEEHPATA